MHTHIYTLSKEKDERREKTLLNSKNGDIMQNILPDWFIIKLNINNKNRNQFLMNYMYYKVKR